MNRLGGDMAASRTQKPFWPSGSSRKIRRAAAKNARRERGFRHECKKSSIAASYQSSSTHEGSANIAASPARSRALGSFIASTPSSGRSSLTIARPGRWLKAAAGHRQAIASTRSGRSMPISMAMRPPIELPATNARSSRRASMRPKTCSANQPAS
jgi:hypothetical protein